MRRILVVIDMQEGAARSRYHRQYLNRKWWKRHSQVVANIRMLARKMETIFQVHTGFRNKRYIEVIAELQYLARSKPIILKDKDDGSDALIDRLPRTTHVYACGMNTDACVLRTVRGLKRKGFTVTVVGDACWTAYASKSAAPHNAALKALRKSGVEVIKTSAVR